MSFSFRDITEIRDNAAPLSHSQRAEDIMLFRNQQSKECPIYEFRDCFEFARDMSTLTEKTTSQTRCITFSLKAKPSRTFTPFRSSISGQETCHLPTKRVTSQTSQCYCFEPSP